MRAEERRVEVLAEIGGLLDSRLKLSDRADELLATLEKVVVGWCIAGRLAGDAAARGLDFVPDAPLFGDANDAAMLREAVHKVAPVVAALLDLGPTTATAAERKSLGVSDHHRVT